MYKLDSYRVKIEANLNPGFYSLQKESAAGKTYLAKILYQYLGYDEPVGSYTYANFLAKDTLKPRLTRETKLFIFDRLDMFYSSLSDEDVELINSCVKSAIILADLKGKADLRGPAPKRAWIHLEDNFIHID